MNCWDPMAETRRLDGIVAADVLGYSRLMGVDEPGKAREHRQAARSIDR
jgi:hypothetical protein